MNKQIEETEDTQNAECKTKSGSKYYDMYQLSRKIFFLKAKLALSPAKKKANKEDATYNELKKLYAKKMQQFKMEKSRK